MRIYSSNSQGLKKMYCFDSDETVGKLNYFAIKNVQVKFHTSLYADEDLMDFYVGTFDQIEGAYPIFKKSFLYNGYTLSTPAPPGIRLGIVNYFSSTYGGNDGSYIPSMLRIAGYFDQTDLAGVSKKISLFFKNMVPFEREDDGEKVTCRLTGTTQPTCKSHKGGLFGKGQSYNNFERVDVEFETIPVGVRGGSLMFCRTCSN